MNVGQRLGTAAILLLAAVWAAGQNLTPRIRALGAPARGTVSTACWLARSDLSCDLNPHGHPPMQSVFKLPLGIFILHQVELGKLRLDQPVRFLASDRILPTAYSPLWDKYPDANVEVPLSELLRYAVTASDNVAADILLRLAGGPAVVNQYVASLDVPGFHLVDNEHALHAKRDLQYRNWFEPTGAVALLRRLVENSPLNAANTALILQLMTVPQAQTRLGAALPPGTVVAHKSGTSDTYGGLARATNDIGLITLPDGRQLAIAIFVTDARADAATVSRAMSVIGAAAYAAAVAPEG